MEISRVRKGEINYFSRLAKKTIMESPYYSSKAKADYTRKFNAGHIERDMKEKMILLLRAKDNEKIIGFMRGYFEGSISSGIFWLNWIGVDETAQRKGVANAMLNYLENILSKRYKVHKIVCVVRIGNKASTGLMKKRKYRKLAVLDKHWHKEDYTFWYKCI